MTLNLADVILRIHAAVLDPPAWTSVLEDVRVALDARGALLHTPWVRSRQDYWYFNAQLDPSEIETYARDWMAYDAWAEGARARGLYLVEGLTYVDDEMVERRRFRRSAFFNDFLQRNDMDRMVTVNLSRRAVHAQLSVFSGVGNEAFGRAHLEVLDHLKPHLLIATRNYCSLRSLLAFSATTEQALNSLATALFAIDRNGRVVYSNEPGDNVLRAGAWLLSIGGKLAAGRDLANAVDCAAALRDVIAGTGATRMLKLGSTSAQRILLTTPVGPGGPLCVPGPPSSAGLIWLLPDVPGQNAIERLAQLFVLTPAETRLLAQLANGNDLRIAAEALDVSVHTARNQLKAALRKTGQHSQAHLLALLNRLAAVVAARTSRG